MLNRNQQTVRYSGIKNLSHLFIPAGIKRIKSIRSKLKKKINIYKVIALRCTYSE